MACLPSALEGCGHRDWSTLLPQLRRDAPTKPHAASLLAAIMMGKANAPVQTDYKAAAAHYCQAIRGFMTPEHNVRGARADALRLTGDCTHNLSILLEMEAVAPGESLYDECIEALRLVVRECGSTEALTAKPANADEGGATAAICALMVLAASAILCNDTDKALQYCTQAVSTYETAYRAGNCEASARLPLDATVMHLRMIMPPSPGLTDLEQLMARASLAEPGRAEAGGRAEPAARPACAGCGTTDVVLKKCKGSCRGANADGRFCSPECFNRSWKAHKKKTGCRNLAKEGAAQGTAAAAAAVGRTPARAPAQAAAAPATQRVIYKASLDDGHGHTAQYEASVDVDAANYAACADVTKPDVDAFKRLVGQCMRQHTDAMLRLQPWRCQGCGGSEPTKVLNNAISYLHLPPPDGPLLFDIAMPYCRRNGTACEKRCIELAREMHAAVSAENPAFPGHTVFPSGGQQRR